MPIQAIRVNDLRPGDRFTENNDRDLVGHIVVDVEEFARHRYVTLWAGGGMFLPRNDGVEVDRP